MMTDSANKTFVFEQDNTHQSTIVDYPLSKDSQTASLERLLQLHCPLAHNYISIYDPDTLKFTLLEKASFLDP